MNIARAVELAMNGTLVLLQLMKAVIYINIQYKMRKA